MQKWYCYFYLRKRHKSKCITDVSLEIASRAIRHCAFEIGCTFRIRMRAAAIELRADTCAPRAFSRVDTCRHSSRRHFSIFDNFYLRLRQKCQSSLELAMKISNDYDISIDRRVKSFAA